MFVLMAGIILYACTDTNEQNIDKGVAPSSNVFVDNTFRKIVDLRCDGNSVELANLAGNPLPAYRKAAVMAFASMRDSLSLVTVAGRLLDPDPEVRLAALFTLGQIGLPQAEVHLIQFYKSSVSDEHKASALLAIGKCGGENSIRFIDSLGTVSDTVSMVSAQCRAMVCLASRGYYSSGTSRRACDYLADTNIHDNARMIAAEYFRYCDVDVAKYTDCFVDAYATAKVVGLKENIVDALGKCKNERAFALLKSIVENADEDGRVVRHALMALRNFPYADSKDMVLPLLNSADVNTADFAADFFRVCGVEADSSMYLDLSRNVQAWQPRTQLLSAAIKFRKDKQDVSDRIKSGFQASSNIFEKAALLRALAYDLSSLDFLMQTLQENHDGYIGYETLRILVDMYEQPEYNSGFSVRKKKAMKFVDKFSMAFRDVVLNGSPEMVSMAAAAISRHPEIVEVYFSTYFLQQAASKCVFPQDIDTYLVLRDVEKLVNGVDLDLDPKLMAYSPDWNYIQSIPENCQVEVTTAKGSFVINLDVNSAPVSVSNFLKLVDDKYFDNTYMNFDIDSRIVNNGSMTGFDENKSIMLPAELNPMGDSEGSVSLVTTRYNKSYSSKWSISLSPSTLNLGKSSSIGSIAEGMSVVNSLNTGDKIISVKRR